MADFPALTFQDGSPEQVTSVQRVIVGGGIVSALATTLNILAHADSVWETDTGNLRIDAAAALNLGTVNATSVNIGKSGMTVTISGELVCNQIAGGRIKPMLLMGG